MGLGCRPLGDLQRMVTLQETSHLFDHGRKLTIASRLRSKPGEDRNTRYQVLMSSLVLFEYLFANFFIKEAEMIVSTTDSYDMITLNQLEF